MASVICCDMCAKITTERAAQILIRIEGDFRSIDDYTEAVAANSSRRQANYAADRVLDLCKECLDKMVTPKVLSIGAVVENL